MDTFPIITEPAKNLRERSRELRVDEVTTPEFQQYLDKLILTMIKHDGVGIASPQIGKNIRAVIVQMQDKVECLINPEIIKKSKNMIESEEGCLSVPGKFGIVSRHKKVTIRALNRHGRKIEFDVK
ncbi:MAG TPA: peptide deformylase, partial [Patescibacteria group bacterium]|nr:peptide deformylase [Patescibacteria group bacterium]